MKQPSLDLWLRLAALKKCCTVILESFFTDTGKGDVERWRVTIRSRDQPNAAPIVVEGGTATEALMRGLDQSLALRWHTESS